MDSSRPTYVPPTGPRPASHKDDPIGLRRALTLSRNGQPDHRNQQPLDGRTAKAQLAITSLAIAVTFIATGFIALDLARTLRDLLWWQNTGQIVAYLGFGAAVFLLIYGGLVYQVSRLGYILRRRRHRPQSDKVLDAMSARPDAPAVTVLVPSFKETPDAVRQTLLSASLQDYPRKSVVLLIDDPPDPTDNGDLELLQAVRALPDEIQASLDAARTRFGESLARLRSQPFDDATEPQRVADAYRVAATWFEEQARKTPVRNHTDRLFVRITFSEPARDLRRRAVRLAQQHAIDFSQAERTYQRLEQRFAVELRSFERKRFVNLCHIANKAMNLNTYIGLFGRSLRPAPHNDGLHLADADESKATIKVARPDYVVTLDADSMLAHGYLLRLIEVLERPGNERLAVAQTPYSAVPASPNAVERIAGATTDIMYVWQQGSTWFDATFWIGANAVIRTAALEDIAVHGSERGFPITRFIQDRTLIEDTDSTVDLIRRGWQLYNYPERLAYSATPPDFGSLIIQRRRWANGGLIILPKLIRYLIQRLDRRLGVLREAFFRIHYVISEAAVNTALVIVFAVPLATGIFSWWIPVSAAPYFALYTLDLKREGYGWSDMLRVYAMNLLLVPVNLAGMFNSLRQAFTGKKVPFGRTPKVEGRVVAPAIYIAAEFGLVVALAVVAALALVEGHAVHGAFALINALFLAYAFVAFIGLRAGWHDLRAAFPRGRRPGADDTSTPVVMPRA